VKSVRTLLESVLDYAGLFPPAALDMAEATNNYAHYCAGELSWILGRFILPVSRMEEFETVVREIPPEIRKGRSWRLSVLGTDNPEADLKRIMEFNQRNFGDIGSGMLVADTIELKVDSEEGVRRTARVFAGHLQTYFEIAISRDMQRLIGVVAEQHGRAKVRTGGLVPDVFPSPGQLANFILLCAREGVPFKATAGLHHAFRAIHPLTYEKSSPLGKMHGFLNLLFASAIAHAGADEESVAAVLSLEDPKAFHFDDGSIQWCSWTLRNVELRAMRNRLFVCFGSCSVREPALEMRKLKLI
jgi:hypothetical protein